jgi:hypothetical protein
MASVLITDKDQLRHNRFLEFVEGEDSPTSGGLYFSPKRLERKSMRSEKNLCNSPYAALQRDGWLPGAALKPAAAKSYWIPSQTMVTSKVASSNR